MQKQKKSAGLMITLGHNSSALFYDGVSKPIGYEEERLNGVKSSSAFPVKSIERIISEAETPALMGAKIFVSHWFDIFDDSQFPEKYYDKAFIDKLINDYGMELVLLSKNFTHHDAHAYSARAFLYDFVNREDHAVVGPMHFIVADGFGNNREVLSVYTLERDDSLKLVERLYGYDMSLGLLYQYATSYCGMKENQDEYKFLGYESHIKDLISQEQLLALDAASDDFLVTYVGSMGRSRNGYIEGSVYLDIPELEKTKANFHKLFEAVMSSVLGVYNIEDLSQTLAYKRSIIGYFVQSCAEKVMQFIVEANNMKNVTLSGGCFYNVKLNNQILKLIPGKICVIPLAGDQGAAIGMFEHLVGGFKFYDLCYGMRRIFFEEHFDEHIRFFREEHEFVAKAVELLNDNKIVNIVSGSMEFGPRALCNTSTLAIPTEANVEYINMINSRNTVMPMAPVIFKRNVDVLFKSNDDLFNRVIGSNKFMIITHDVSEDAIKAEKYRGVMHVYPDKTTYSARPQIVYDTEKPIGKILDKVHSLALINTSFNTHGTPILFDTLDCIDDYIKQKSKDLNEKVYLLFLAND